MSKTFAALFTSLIISSAAFCAQTDCGETWNPMHLGVRHIEGKGIGYNQGYSTAELFMSKYCQDRGLPFIDLRGHIFNDGRWATNAGFGYRYLTSKWVFGGNAYYDYRKTSKSHYNQVGVGLEALGERYDLRVNGYVPVGKKSSHLYCPEFKCFGSNSIILSSKRQFPMHGVNIEGGAHLGQLIKYKQLEDALFYSAIGPYWFGGKGQNAWGGKFRIRADYKQYVFAEASVSYDNVFKDIFQGELGFSFPFGPKARIKRGSAGINDCSTLLVLKERMIQPVSRFEIIVADTHRKSVVATDCSGCPFNVLFVNNKSTSSLGTFERPFATLKEAQNNSQPGNIIFVFRGDGTSKGMNSGIVLKPNQILWGSGVNHSLITCNGCANIPSCDTSLPVITNTSGNGITLASGVQVSGIDVSRAFNHGIFGHNISSAFLSDLTVFSAGVNGISFDQSEPAKLDICNVLAVSNTLGSGINLSTSGGAVVDLSVRNSESSLNGINLSMTPIDLSVIRADISKNRFKNSFSGAGIDIESSSNSASPHLYAFRQNVITGSAGGAILGNFNGNASIRTNLAENCILNNQTGNQPGAVTLNFNGTGASELKIVGNQVLDNGLDGFAVTGGVGKLNIVAASNKIVNNSRDGFAFTSIGPQAVNLSFGNNEILDNLVDGINITSTFSGAANLNLLLAHNKISGNTDNGLNIHDSTYATLNMIFRENEISGNHNNAIRMDTLTLNKDLNFSMDKNLIKDNGSRGIGITTTTIANNLNFAVTNSEISGNGTEGIFFDTALVVANQSNVTIRCNQITNNGATGVDLGSLASLNLNACGNNISGNQGFGLISTSTNANITITKNSFNNNASEGIALTANPDAGHSFNAVITDNTLINNANIGFGLTFAPAAAGITSSSLLFARNTVTNNASSGSSVLAILIDRPFAINFADNTFNFNAGNGFAFDIGSSSTAFTTPLSISGNSSNNNNGSGLTITNNAANIVANVSNNSFSKNNPNASSPNNANFLVINNPGSDICLTLIENTSFDTGYNLVNTGNLFKLAPVNADAVNIGTIFRAGVITPVGSCP